MTDRHRARVVGCRALIIGTLLLSASSQRATGQGEEAIARDSERPGAGQLPHDAASRDHPPPLRDSTRSVVRASDTTSSGGSLTDAVTDAAREYTRTGVARTVEEGAFETFPYGHGQPTLTCAPLRACVIELEAGESVLSRIAGDTQRWEIELAPAGADGRTALIVVKPHDCGLTTNLVLTTTAGRIYDLTLDSPPCVRGGTNPHGVYLRHVRFYYPDATVQAWTPPPAPTVAHAQMSAMHADAFSFGYRTRRSHHFPWVPVAVFDDGVHCYIKLPGRAAHGDAPVLFAIADDGTRMLLNYSLTNETYVTDRVFRSAELVIGEPGSERVLRIDNLRYDGPESAEGASSAPSASAPRQGGPPQ